MQGRYGRPPIVQSVIDLRIKREREITPSELKAASSALLKKYPRVTDVRGSEWKVGPGAVDLSDARARRNAVIGVRLSSSDGVQSVQFLPRGMTFTNFGVYQDWSALFYDAMFAWSIYTSRLGPIHLFRCGARYVNKFSIPHQRFEIRDYFRVHPEAPDEIGDVTGYFMQMQVPRVGNEGAISAVINFAPGENVAANEISLILDLDVYQEIKEGVDPAVAREILPQIRIAKNKLFEWCITDATRELIS